MRQQPTGDQTSTRSTRAGHCQEGEGEEEEDDEDDEEVEEDVAWLRGKKNLGSITVMAGKSAHTQLLNSSTSRDASQSFQLQPWLGWSSWGNWGECAHFKKEVKASHRGKPGGQIFPRLKWSSRDFAWAGTLPILAWFGYFLHGLGESWNRFCQENEIWIGVMINPRDFVLSSCIWFTSKSPCVLKKDTPSIYSQSPRPRFPEVWHLPWVVRGEVWNKTWPNFSIDVASCKRLHSYWKWPLSSLIYPSTWIFTLRFAIVMLLCPMADLLWSWCIGAFHYEQDNRTFNTEIWLLGPYWSIGP